MIDLSANFPKIFLISGPSGVGKDTIIAELRKIYFDFHFVVTAVTRKKRSDEKEGVNHFFISPNKFKSMIENNQLIEWSKVYDNFYGVPKSQIETPISQGKSVFIRVDVQGAEKIKKIMPEIVLIFIKPENLEYIRSHLDIRGENSEDDIKKRIEAAKKEILLAKNFDYVITNQEGNIKYVIDAVKDIIKKNL
ncbi:MAG: guanylate kinase [Chloroflexi bacterium]|nr:guanylate kinase [Chloroflexota bacterium]